jgi:hypothetical protein
MALRQNIKDNNDWHDQYLIVEIIDYNKYLPSSSLFC